MKVAIYARVSTVDKEQDPETQLQLLRAESDRLGYEVYREYVDRASALDVKHKTAWRQLLKDAQARKFQVVLVYRLDRAFRSMIDLHLTLATWESCDVAFKSYSDPGIDMITATGRLLLNILGSFAEFERGIIAERVRAGMARAKNQGKRMGRRRKDYPVENIVYIYRSLPEGRGRLSETARRVGVNRGSVRDRLLEAGLIE